MTRLPALVPGDGGLASRLLLLAPAWLILFVAALTPTAALFPDQGDVVLYFDKARAVAVGQIPYRDFSFHYPPGALFAMLVPMLGRLVGPVDLDAYKILFGGWQALQMLALGLVLARIAERTAVDEAARLGSNVDREVADRARQVGLRLALLSLGAALALTWRYDLFPALLVMVAVWAAIERRPVWVGAMLGIGVLAKLYPVALLPALAIPWLAPFDARGLVRLGASFGLAIVAGLLPFVAVAGTAALAFFQYQVGHGIQIESIGGGIATLAGLITGAPPELSFANARVQVEGPVAEAWLAIVPMLTVAGFAALGWIGLRRVRAELASGGGEIRAGTIVALAGVSVLMLLVTSKVYSIQYVVWLIPFMAFLRGRRFWLAAAITALTIPIHPVLYSELVRQEALPIILVNLRNGLLALLTLWMLMDLARGDASDRLGETKPAPPAEAEAGP